MGEDRQVTKVKRKLLLLRIDASLGGSAGNNRQSKNLSALK
jgi:hypothetical protein